MPGLILSAEVPRGVRVTVLSAVAGRLGYPLLRRLMFAEGVDYQELPSTLITGFLKSDNSRDIGREKFCEHLHVEGRLQCISPPTIINTADSFTIVDGDGSTACSSVAFGNAVPGVYDTSDGIQKSCSGNGFFAPVAAGAWGTQNILSSSIVGENGPRWWRSNGCHFYGLTCHANGATFGITQNSYACYGNPTWWYSVAGYIRRFEVTVELISNSQYRVTWVNTSNRVPLKGPPQWADAAVLAPWSEVGDTTSAWGYQIPLSVNRPSSVNRLISAVLAPQKSDVSVAQKALDAYREVHSNSVENASQLARGVSSLLPLEAAMHAFQALALAKSRPLDSAVHSSKAMASLYLWWRYVAKTTYNDLREWRRTVKGGLERFNNMCDSPRRLRAMETFTVEEAGYPIQVRVAELFSVAPYPWMRAFNRMLTLGFEPGLGQAWDLIPFSFVVDWFTNFSGILRAVDWHFYKALLGINARVSSRKSKYEGPVDEDGWHGDVKISFYKRIPSASAPSLAELLPIPRSVPMKNWFPAAAALAIAR